MDLCGFCFQTCTNIMGNILALLEIDVIEPKVSKVHGKTPIDQVESMC